MHPHPALGLLATAFALNAAAQDLPREPDALQTVVVTATRHAMAMIDAPAALGVVTRAQIEQRGADNVLEALRGELGVSLVARPISGRKAISLRGMESRHTLVLVDGMRIGASDGVIGHSDFQHDWIPVEDIERIEVIRGPMSVLYGAEALGGVVNLVTRPVGTAWTFGMLAEGTFSDDARGGEGHRVALRAAGPLGAGLALAATAAESRRDPVASPADARISDLEGRTKRDAGLKLGWQATADQRLEAEHRQGTEDREAGMRERGGTRRFFTSTTRIERRHDALGWSADWGGALDLRTQLRAYRSALDMDNARDQGVAALRPNRLRDRVLEGQAAVAAGAAQRLTAGFERRDETLLNAGLPGGQADARHGALYLQDEWQAQAALALTFGLRVDHASRFGTERSPRAYAVWRPAPAWTVKGGVGHGFKAPTLKQISPDYVEDEGPYTYHGNAAVRPETNDALELGLGWDTPDAGAQAMLFDNRVKDLIVTRPTGVVGGRQHFVFANEARARLRGLEAAASLRWGGGFKASVNYVYLDARDGQGQRLEKRARHTLGAQLDVARGPVEAGLRLEHTRGLVLASTVAGQPAQPVPAYAMLGAQLRLQLGMGLEVGLGLDNLGNVRLADKSPLFTQGELPRSVRLSLRGRW